MAGIRVNRPQGDGWEHSLNQTDWQTSRVFATQPGGAAFVVGTEYTVYSRHLVDNVVAVGKIIFSEPTNDPTLLRLVKSATAAERREALLLMLQAVDTHPASKAELCEIVGSCTIEPEPVAPAPIFDQFIHYIEVADTVADSIDVEVDDEEWEDVIVADSIDVEVDESEWEEVVVADSIDVEVDDSEWEEEVCQRPAGTTTYALAWNYTPQGGTTRLFTSLADANNASGAVLDDTDAGSLATFFVGILSLAVGQTVYLGVDLSCAVADDKIYYVLANGEVDTVKKAITVVGGVITAIADSTYETPEPPTFSHRTLNDVTIVEGETGIVQVTNHYLDGSTSNYTGPGELVFTPPYPDGVTVETLNGTATINVPDDSVTATVEFEAVFESPDQADIQATVTITNVNPEPEIEVSHVAIHLLANGDVNFYYKSPQTGDQNLEDSWSGYSANWLNSVYAAPPVSGRPAGYENYQYLDQYFAAGSGEFLTALQGATTFSIQKAGETTPLLVVNFDGSALDPGEIQIIYPPQN